MCNTQTDRNMNTVKRCCNKKTSTLSERCLSGQIKEAELTLINVIYHKFFIQQWFTAQLTESCNCLNSLFVELIKLILTLCLNYKCGSLLRSKRKLSLLAFTSVWVAQMQQWQLSRRKPAISLYAKRFLKYWPVIIISCSICTKYYQVHMCGWGDGGKSTRNISQRRIQAFDCQLNFEKTSHEQSRLCLIQIRAVF